MKLLLVFLLTYTLFGCKSHDLTRESALSMLKGMYPQRTPQKLYIRGWCSTDLVLRQTLTVLRDLEQKGYVTFSKYYINTPGGDFSNCQINITDKGNPFLISKSDDFLFVDAFDKNLVDVTGITDGSTPTQKIVEFTTTVSNTPFSPCFDINSTGTQTHKALFQKFDDGWRFQNMMDQPENQ